MEFTNSFHFNVRERDKENEIRVYSGIDLIYLKKVTKSNSIDECVGFNPGHHILNPSF